MKLNKEITKYSIEGISLQNITLASTGRKCATTSTPGPAIMNWGTIPHATNNDDETTARIANTNEAGHFSGGRGNFNFHCCLEPYSIHMVIL